MNRMELVLQIILMNLIIQEKMMYLSQNVQENIDLKYGVLKVVHAEMLLEDMEDTLVPKSI